MLPSHIRGAMSALNLSSFYFSSDVFKSFIAQYKIKYKHDDMKGLDTRINTCNDE